MAIPPGTERAQPGRELPQDWVRGMGETAPRYGGAVAAFHLRRLASAAARHAAELRASTTSRQAASHSRGGGSHRSLRSTNTQPAGGAVPAGASAATTVAGAEPEYSPGKARHRAIRQGEEPGFVCCGRGTAPGQRNRGGLPQRHPGSLAADETQPAEGFVPELAEQAAAGHGARQKLQVIDFQNSGQLLFAKITRGGGAMAVFHDCRGHVHAGPAALPGAIAQVQVLYVGRLIGFVNASQGVQFRGIVERTAAAAVEHPGLVLAGEGLVAAHGEILGAAGGHHGFAGFFAAHAGGKADLRRGAKQARSVSKRRQERIEESWIEQHIVVQQADMGEAGAGDAAIDGAGER